MTHEDPRELADDDERRQAHDPNVGTGTPETAPLEEPVVSWLRRQPLLAMLIVLEAPVIGTLISSYVAGAPELVKILATVLAPLAAVLVLAARQVVTPIARPRLSADLPLVVAGDDQR